MVYLLVGLVVLIWGSSATVSRLLIDGINPYTLQTYTSAVAFISITVVVLSQKKVKDLFVLKSVDYRNLFVMGVLGNFLYVMFFYLAIDRLDTQVAYALNYLWPVMIVLTSIFVLKDQLTFRKVIAITISFLAVVLFVTKGNLTLFDNVDILGVLFGLGAAFTYGLFSTLNKKYGYDSVVANFFFIFFSLALNLIRYFILEDFYIPNTSQILGIVWMGVFVNAIAFILWLQSLKLGNVNEIANLSYLTPFVSLVYIAVFLNEPIHITGVLGLLMIVLSILWQGGVLDRYFKKLRKIITIN